MEQSSKIFIALGVVIIAIIAIFSFQKGTGTPSGFRQGILLTSRDVVVLSAAEKAARYPRAEEISTPDGFINADKFTLADLAHDKKVVLVDFWTYSCINCERTIPYLNAWYEKYHKQGFEIVGVHTPEFSFEKQYENVAAAVKKYHIKYPVVLDNDYSTWNSYKNLYWPHEYLIDEDGFIIYDHVGEGNYDETEQRIQSALAARAKALHQDIVMPSGTTAVDASSGTDLSKVASPETYFGAARNEYFGNGAPKKEIEVYFVVPRDALNPNKFYLGGKWNIVQEFAENKSPSAKISYRFHAKDVYLVASAQSPVKIQVFLDGAPAGKAGGADVSADGSVTIHNERLYHIVSNPAGYGEHILQLIIEQPGLRAYTLTFG